MTDRNILTTSGELRLIKNRAESLYRENGIVTDFVVVSKKERIVNKTETIVAGGNIVSYEMSVRHPYISISSHKSVIQDIKTRLAKKDYGAVILSGFAMPVYAKTIKQVSHIPVLLDIHGASEDMLELAKSSSKQKGMMLQTLYHIDQKITKHSLNNIDGFFVVTESLREYFKARYSIDDNRPFFIVPCATNGEEFNREKYLKDRKKYRGKYHIDKDEVVFIYSGGISPWQCVSETIELYIKIANFVERKTRLLVFSHNKDAIIKMADGDERIQIDSYSPDELAHALSAGDYAFLLRANNITNNVAFPNKFLEYVQSGMRIITTPYVKEIAKQVKENNLGFIYDFNMNLEPLLADIQECGLSENREECINAVLKYNSFSVTTRNFVEWYEARSYKS